MHTAHPTSRVRRCDNWVPLQTAARPCPIMNAYAQVACIATIPCIALLPFGTDIRSGRMSRECDDVCSRFPPHASESTCRACCVAFARATCAKCVFLQLPHDHAFVGRGQTTRPVTAKSGRSSGHFHDVGNGFATQPRKEHTTVWLKGAITHQRASKCSLDLPIWGT